MLSQLHRDLLRLCYKVPERSDNSGRMAGATCDIRTLRRTDRDRTGVKTPHRDERIGGGPTPLNFGTVAAKPLSCSSRTKWCDPIAGDRHRTARGRKGDHG